jgi:membrane-bound serine protease (ClpP class)
MLGVYCEFLWPGRVLPGIYGAAATVIGGYHLWRAVPSALGLELLALAAACFLLDALVSTYFLAGAVATVALAFGFVRLIPGDHGIHPLLSIPWCIVFGAITMFLNWSARRARRNKQL